MPVENAARGSTGAPERPKKPRLALPRKEPNNTGALQEACSTHARIRGSKELPGATNMISVLEKSCRSTSIHSANWMALVPTMRGMRHPVDHKALYPVGDAGQEQLGGEGREMGNCGDRSRTSQSVAFSHGLPPMPPLLGTVTALGLCQTIYLARTHIHR